MNDQTRETVLPPAVIFHSPRRIWRLAVINAWEDYSRRHRDLPPLPRFLLAHTCDRLEELLAERPQSFVILSAKRVPLKELHERIKFWTVAYPLSTFVMTEAPRGSAAAFWEMGIRCVIGPPREAIELAPWLAWHLNRLPQLPSAWTASIWDRLPWPELGNKRREAIEK